MVTLKIPNKPRGCSPMDSLLPTAKPTQAINHRNNNPVKRTRKMGYAVLHLDKAKGADSGMSAHIERTIHPKNADPTRTHLNRELIQFPEGVTNRTQAIQHRLDTAGLKRKIANNQVRAIRILLTGTHEDMMQIEKEGRLPDAVLACVGGGSNAIGSFYHFINDKNVRLIGCEAAGKGIDTFETAATMATGKLGIFHGMKSYFCQDEYGQIAPVYSISAGLDYPGVGPEHAMLHDQGRAEYVAITDDEAVDAFEYLSRVEGIIPAIESSHALAYAKKLAPTMSKDQIIIVTVSGRGDKDCAAIARYRGEDLHD